MKEISIYDLKRNPFADFGKNWRALTAGIKEFIDREDYFTVTAFDESYRKALGYLGSHSGRDADKITNTGLTPVFDNNTTYFAEGRLVYICKYVFIIQFLIS